MRELVRLEVIDAWPALADTSATFRVVMGTRVIDLISFIEISQQWSYQSSTRSFVEGQPQVVVVVRLRQIGGGADLRSVRAGLLLAEWSMISGDGEFSVSDQQSRTYESGTVGEGGRVATGVGTVSAGTSFSGLVKRSYGGRVRVTGQVSRSSFLGGGLEKRSLDIRINHDSRLGEEVPVLILTDLEASALLAYRGTVGLSASKFVLTVTVF